MAKRSGLGRGLDGMFPSYQSKETGQKEKEAAGAKKSGKEKAGRSAGSGNDTVTDKENREPAAKEKKPAAEKEDGTENAAVKSDTPEQGVTYLKISSVEPNRGQPRKEFQEAGLTELAQSIRQYGVLQPLVVQQREDYYEIIAGERRWRAARMAGLKEVPVIIKDYNEQEIVEVSLIENIQREDLNPIEEAQAYQRLLDEFSLRQEDIAKRVAKNRSTVTNSLRLLKLDQRVQQLLISGELTGGHARALLSLENKDQQYEAADRIVKEHLSVREVEKLIRSIQRGNSGKKKPAKKEEGLDLVYESMENDMKAALGTMVHVNRKSSSSGKIEIEYYSMEELERLFELIRRIAKA